MDHDISADRDAPVIGGSVPPLSTAQQVRDHWAFKPVSNPVPPKIDSDWARNPVDQFVLRRLTKAGMEPSKRADRRTLIRRATMSLTGLMPTYAKCNNSWPTILRMHGPS